MITDDTKMNDSKEPIDPMIEKVEQHEKLFDSIAKYIEFLSLKLDQLDVLSTRVDVLEREKDHRREMMQAAIKDLEEVKADKDYVEAALISKVDKTEIDLRKKGREELYSRVLELREAMNVLDEKTTARDDEFYSNFMKINENMKDKISYDDFKALLHPVHNKLKSFGFILAKLKSLSEKQVITRIKAAGITKKVFTEKSVKSRCMSCGRVSEEDRKPDPVFQLVSALPEIWPTVSPAYAGKSLYEPSFTAASNYPTAARIFYPHVQPPMPVVATHRDEQIHPDETQRGKFRVAHSEVPSMEHKKEQTIFYVSSTYDLKQTPQPTEETPTKSRIVSSDTNLVHLEVDAKKQFSDLSAISTKSSSDLHMTTSITPKDIISVETKLEDEAPDIYLQKSSKYVCREFDDLIPIDEDSLLEKQTQSIDTLQVPSEDQFATLKKAESNESLDDEDEAPYVDPRPPGTLSYWMMTPDVKLRDSYKQKPHSHKVKQTESKKAMNVTTRSCGGKHTLTTPLQKGLKWPKWHFPPRVCHTMLLKGADRNLYRGASTIYMPVDDFPRTHEIKIDFEKLSKIPEDFDFDSVDWEEVLQMDSFMKNVTPFLNKKPLARFCGGAHTKTFRQQRGIKFSEFKFPRPLPRQSIILDGEDGGAYQGILQPEEVSFDVRIASSEVLNVQPQGAASPKWHPRMESKKIELKQPKNEVKHVYQRVQESNMTESTSSSRNAKWKLMGKKSSSKKS